MKKSMIASRVCCVFAVLAVGGEAFATKYAPPGYAEYVDTDWYSYVDTGVVSVTGTPICIGKPHNPGFMLFVK